MKKINVRQWILKWFVVQWFVVKVLPKARFSFQPPKITPSMFYEFQDLIRTGDIVFSVDRSKLAAWLIHGQWSHAAVVSATGLIVEAHQPCVHQITAFEFCHTSDAVGIARPKDPKLAARFAAEAHVYLGIPYDSLFAKGREALYCSELIWEMDADNELGFDASDTKGLGVPYVSPDGLWCAQHIDRILG